jgi:hypothetical protein
MNPGALRLNRKNKKMRQQLTLTKMIPKPVRFGPALAGLALLVIAASSLSGQVLPPSSLPYGQSYAGWSAQWWQWTLSQSTNQIEMVSGPMSGPVEFLAGATASDTETRKVTIPAGTSLFFPILSTWDDNSSCPAFTTNTVAELQAAADGNWSAVTVTTCTIDGVAVGGLGDPQTSDYFTQATPFSYTTALTNSVIDAVYGDPCIAGGTTIGPAVADGVYVMLAPLAVGTHTIEFVGIVGPTNAPYLDVDLTYQVTVQTAFGAYPPDTTPYGKSYAEWSAAWWQWSLSRSTNQINLVSGPMSGPVEFLAGAPGSDTETRKVTIPDGTALFFPILSTWDDNSGCPAFTTNTLAELQAEVEGAWSAVTVTTCTIDGVAVGGLDNPQTTGYLTQSTPFSYTTALTNSVLATVYGDPCIPGGTTIAPAVAEGVYLMLAPLPAGNHTIQFVGIVGPTNAPYLDVDLTYQITTLPAPLTIAAQGATIVLSWPQTATSYVVESASTLSSPNWSQVSLPIQEVNGNFQVTIPIGVGSQYFRLHGH